MSQANASSPTARTNTSSTSRPNPANYPGSATRRSLAVAAAVLAAVVLWLVAVPVLGLDLAVGAGAQAQQVTLALVVVVPLLAGAAAWGLLAVLERRTVQAVTVWRIIGWTFLAVSLLGPLGMGAAAGTLTVLLLHVSVGTILNCRPPRTPCFLRGRASRHPLTAPALA